jgi:surface protein
MSSTIISNDNIEELVSSYIHDTETLPDDLQAKPIGEWDVSNVTDMSQLFFDTSFNEPIGSWDVSNVTDMCQMFGHASVFNQPIGNWNVSNVTDMQEMFAGATSFNQPIGNWDVSKVKNMSRMFMEAMFFNQPIGNWDVSKVTHMQEMFAGAMSFNQPIGNWNVSKVTDMSQMFTQAESFNQPIGDWNVSKVTHMEEMFRDATSFNQPIGSWNVSNVTTMSFMFEGATSFNQDIGNWNMSNVVDMDQSVSSLLWESHEADSDEEAESFNQLVPAVLRNNRDYKPSLLPAPQFSVSNEKVYRDSKYSDIYTGDDTPVLSALDEDPTAFVFNVNKQFYVISESNLTNVMNDPNVIKYECLRVDSMANIERRVPYLSMNSIGIQSQGAVPFFDLWTAVHSGNRTYELVKTARLLPSTASHNVLYNSGAQMSAAHCQAGQDVNVYELRILPVDREHTRRSAAMAAIKIQKVIRGRRTRRSSVGTAVAKKVRRYREYRESRRKFHDSYVKRQHAIRQNRAAFNAAFPPSRSLSKTRSNTKTRSNARSRSNTRTRSNTKTRSNTRRTRSNRHSANF